MQPGESFIGGAKEKVVRLKPQKMLFMYAVFSLLSILITTPRSEWLNWYLSIAWSIHFVVAGMGIVQAVRNTEIRMSTFTGKTDKKVIFLIPTICRKDTLPALVRVVNSILKYAPANIIRFRVDVVIEEDAEARQEVELKYHDTEKMRIVVIPRDYTTPNNTRHKARANQYATDLRREEGDNSENVYVYHLDDDTHVEEDTIASIAEFITKNHGDKYLAQGILTFPHELTPSWICRMADSVRPADDVMRFRFFTEVVGTPLGGLHGEHLLIRADIEDEIEWDFGDVLVEDAYFGLRFAEKYPKCAGVLNSYSYGASPSTLWDLIKQRRRWSHGLQKLIFDSRFPLKVRLPLIYFVMTWILGLFQFVGFMLIAAYLGGFHNTSPVIEGLIFIWCFNLAYFMWQYIEGLQINMSVSEKEYGKLSGAFYSILMLPMLFYFTLIEGFASFLGIINRISGKGSFEVIRKEF